MEIEGKPPIKGLPGNPAKVPAASSKTSGKSFGAALQKASAALSGSARPAPTALPGAPEGKSAVSGSKMAGHAAADAFSGADAPAASPENHLETIKFRMKTGYYDSKSINEALTDKLTGFFDDLA